jgi:hypothetical protein
MQKMRYLCIQIEDTQKKLSYFVCKKDNRKN